MMRHQTGQNQSQSILNELQAIGRCAALRLGEVPLGCAPSAWASCRLVFPEGKQSGGRVSEQEARVVYCQVLEQTQFCYAIEAPTVQTYQWLGNRETHARSDAALYTATDGTLKRVANVEFKAGLSEPKAIGQDIEKLLREALPGAWFHVLDRADERRWDALREKFRTALKGVDGHVSSDSPPIVFTFCVLEPFRVASRVLRLSDSLVRQQEIDGLFGTRAPW